jgi:glutamyl-Q tRNA(Asp) synthetase
MIVTRFAPSPTGHLHLGHAFAALTAYDAARRHGGRFLLRIEDIDRDRCRLEFEQAIYEDLAWIGLEWEEPPLRQSERMDTYRAALARLDAGGLVYPCFCTRTEIAAEIARAAEAPHSTEGPLYPGTCRELSEAERQVRLDSGIPCAFRLKARKALGRIGEVQFEEHGRGPSGEHGTITADPMVFGDVVLARKALPAAYHLAVVVDDAFQGVTMVTRGEDLFMATHVQQLIRALLNLPSPIYAHHKLILDGNGRKFSKRDRGVTLREMRQSGFTPEQIRERLGLVE